MLYFLKPEAVGEGQEDQFLKAPTDELSADEIQRMIDANVKGIRTGKLQFYPLVLSPRKDEVAHIGSAPAKLKEYTRWIISLIRKRLLSCPARVGHNLGHGVSCFAHETSPVSTLSSLHGADSGDLFIDFVTAYERYH
ncbi:MAG: hypothetical protein EOO61_07520 [Hymenobacter sp.]|nr:MAG: hypothetical protein EOO61_07520 [Hymenobacter sp.]